MAASALTGLNALLLLVLSVVWVRNYRTFQTPITLGLLAFALVLLVENAVAIYFFFSMAMFYSADPAVQQAVLVLRALQFVALVFLTYVTLQ